MLRPLLHHLQPLLRRHGFEPLALLGRERTVRRKAVDLIHCDTARDRARPRTQSSGRTLLPRGDECRVGRVGRTLPLVQIEQHRRALRHGTEQVAKLAERIRADDVAVVCRNEDAIESLAGEHREMVLPEIRHHFLQLPVADHGARELRRLHVAENALILPKLLAQLRIAL